MTFKTWLNDSLERVISTLIQTGIPFIILAIRAEDTSWVKGLLTALLAALGSVILAIFSAPLPPIKSYPLDVLFRLAKTILVTLAAAFTADVFDILDVSGWQAILVSVVTSVLVFVKAELAKRKAGTITPASFAVAA